MKVNFEMLRALNFGAAADALEAEWKGAYGPTHSNDGVRTPTRRRSRSPCADTPIPQLGSKKLAEVLSFQVLQNECEVAVARLAAGAQPPPGNVPALVAAASLFFCRNPCGYDDAVQGRVLGAIALSIPPGVRGFHGRSERGSAECRGRH
jgi:hypothetical protein